MAATIVQPFAGTTTATTNQATGGFLTFGSTLLASGFTPGALAWFCDNAGGNIVQVRIVSVNAAVVQVAKAPVAGAGQGLVPEVQASGLLLNTGGLGFSGNYGGSGLSASTYPIGSVLTQWGPQLSDIAPDASGGND